MLQKLRGFFVQKIRKQHYFVDSYYLEQNIE